MPRLAACNPHLTGKVRTWTAPASGNVIIKTAGSNFDTTLAAYTGSSVSALTAIASNDDSGGTLQSLINFNAVAGTTYQIAVDGYLSYVGNINLGLNLGLLKTGTTGIDNLVGDNGDDTLMGLEGNDVLNGGAGNDILNGGVGKDTLTGGAGNDTHIFQFGQSTVSLTDRITDFAFGTDTIDLLTQVGLATAAPISFSRATDNTANTLTSVVTSVFTDANGATAGNQLLGVNSAALVVATNAAITGTYLVVNDGTAGFQAANDLVVNLTGYTGILPALGNITPASVFV